MICPKILEEDDRDGTSDLYCYMECTNAETNSWGCNCSCE